MFHRPSPPALFVGSVLAMLGLAAFVPGPRLLAIPWNLTGAVAVLAGVWLHRRATALFHRRGTTRAARGVPSRLVTEGPFAWTRNPMYLAGLLILAGLGVLLRHAVPLLVVPVFGTWAARDYIRSEERILEERFGDEYRQYRVRVRRWI